ncbi:MAG: uncharacterized protein H6R26_422 [Proteobacteria bacterium]|nr:uncharacterized protein [Pseudomonadota bacterium]
MGDRLEGTGRSFPIFDLNKEVGNGATKTMRDETLTATSKGRLAGAGVALLAGLVQEVQAASGNSEMAAMKEQIKALQQTVKVLQAQVEKAETKADDAKTKADNTESQVTAANEAAPATQDDIQGLQTDLENFKWQWQRERETHTALSTRALTIFGTVQAKYGWNQLPVTDPSTDERDNSFDIGTGLIGFRGNLYRDYEEGRNLEYQLSFGASPQTGVASANLLDAFVRYNALPTINLEDSRLNLTLGQQLLPFGLEVTATEDLKPLINNAQFTRPFNPVDKYPGLGLRQIGFIARGDLFPQVDYAANYRAPLIEYAAGVVNGSGPNRGDNNSEKDYVGRLAFTAPVDYNSWFRELKIGTSFYFGTQNRQIGTTFVDPGEKNRVGVDLSYNHNPYGLTFEWMRGWDGDLGKDGITPTVANPGYYNRNSEAFVTTLFYNFGEQFVKSYRDRPKYDDWWPKSYQPFFRWDRWDPNLEQDGDQVDILTPGFNAFFAETTKLQLNYNIKFRQGKKVDEDEFLLQVQYGF